MVPLVCTTPSHYTLGSDKGSVTRAEEGYKQRKDHNALPATRVPKREAPVHTGSVFCEGIASDCGAAGLSRIERARIYSG